MQVDDDDDMLEGESGLVHSQMNSDACSIYPNAEVRVEKAQYSILHLRKLCEDRKELIIDPDFQRNEVWGRKQISELVESILMGIPIPVMYLFETKEGKKQVVDGRQRITSILDFLNGKISLKDLTILSNLNGKKFLDLDSKLQGIFEDYQLSFYIIQPPTPERVKYDIFDRVNRGGTRLNNQEMRNALYRGKSTELIDFLSTCAEFKMATDKGISPKRMRDRYIVLRAIAFYLFFSGKLNENNSDPIEYKSDIDDFLAKVMVFINEQMDDESIYQCKKTFMCSMKSIYTILGENAFRFEGVAKRRPINMALFECLSYLFMFPESATVSGMKEKVIALKEELDNSITFSGNLDAALRVQMRFNRIEQLIESKK